MIPTIHPFPLTGAAPRPSSAVTTKQLFLGLMAAIALCLVGGCASFNTVAKNAPDSSLCGPFPDNYVELLRGWVSKIRPEPVRDLVTSKGKTVREFEVTFVGKPIPARDASGTNMWLVPVVIEKRAVLKGSSGNKATVVQETATATQYEVFIRDGQIKNPTEVGSGNVRDVLKFFSKHGYAYVVGYSAKLVQPAFDEATARAAKVDR